jgi:acyl-CoA synthetase (AMP-forming)/AMP-acid ligase II
MTVTIPNDPAPIPADLRRHYLASGLWDDSTLPSLLLAGLRRHPQQRVRLWSNRIRRHESFATLESTALRFAAGLAKRGVAPGDRVVIWLPNGWEALVAFVGAAVLGAVVVPVASFYGRKDIVEIANAASARVVVTCTQHGRRDYLDEVCGSRGELPSGHTIVRCGGGGSRHGDTTAFEDLLATPEAPQSPRSADDVCLLGFTSGTSGTAKAVVHTHHTLCAEVRNHLTAMVPRGAVPQIMASPVAHAAGMTLGLLAPIYRGEPIHLIDSFDVDFLLDTAHTEGLAPGGGAAVFLSALIDHPNFTDELADRMRYVILGGSTVPEALVTKAAARGVTVLRSYGLTEHPTVSTGALTDDPAVLARSDGRLLPGVEVEIRDGAGNALPVGSEGEIFTRGPDRCAGYLQSEMNSAFDSEGWLATGDIGVLDSAGYLAITDRSKDLIIRNGVNIAPAEVENALLMYPDVAEVAVVGLPDDRTGERAVAVVVAHRGHAISLTALTDHLAALGVAKPKWPEELRLTDHLPRTASGKVRKNELRKAFS